MPVVVKLHYHRKSKVLDVHFADSTHEKNSVATFSAEFLRVHSPSAEVQGHGQPRLVANKKDVGIVELQPSGHYAVRILFDDGHQTGIYSWAVLWHFYQHHDTLWQDYLNRLKAANAVRDTRLL